MTNKFYQVLGAIGDRKTETLFSDLSAKKLHKQFVGFCRISGRRPSGRANCGARIQDESTCLTSKVCAFLST